MEVKQNHRPFIAVFIAVLFFGLVFVSLDTLQPAAADHFGNAWGTPVDPDTGLPTGPDGRHFRVLVAVDAPGMDGVRDLPVQASLDLAEILANDAGYPAETSSRGIRLSGFELAIDSFIVQEVDETGIPLDGDYLPVIVEPGDVHGDGSFDPVREPVVTTRWVMPGVTGDTRYFHIYFDSTHNNPGTGPTFSTAEEMALVTSIGPGRGTVLFIPLNAIAGPQAGSESRRAHVTALHDDTTVQFYEYTSAGTPRSNPVREVTLSERGDSTTYGLGQEGSTSSHGTVMVTADRPVLAEALSVRASDWGSFVPNNFIPSTDGGFLGSQFVASPVAPETWHVFCPTLVNNDDCLVNGQTIRSGNTRSYSMGAGSNGELAAENGARVIVQRAGNGLAYWPPVDGPDLATHFMGHIGANDDYIATAGTPQTRLTVRSLETASWLASSSQPWELPQRGLFQNHMSRGWPAGGHHETGGLRIEALRGTAFEFTSGNDAAASSLIVPQSSDGGRTYRISVPTDNEGNPMGRIAIFALYDSTSVSTQRIGGGSETLPALRAGERFDLDADAGVWTIQGDRPIVVSWLSIRSPPNMGAYAPGFTDVAEVTVVGADYAGYAFEMQLVGPSSLQREGGDSIQFFVDVTNRARNVAGEGLSDTAHADLRVPDDNWQPQLDLSSRALGPDETGRFGMNVRVPDGVTPGSGATLRPVATSEGNGNLEVERSLQINFIVRHAVEIREAADMRELSIEHGETATYEVLVINRGSGVDTFHMEFACPPDGWAQEIVPLFDSVGESEPGEVMQPLQCDSLPEDLRTPDLAPGEQATYFVHMSPGDEVNMASRATTRISATSVGDRSVTDSLRLSTIVGAERSFRVLVEEPTRTIHPGSETTFHINVHNDAEVNEELHVELHSSVPPGWGDPEVRWVEEGAALQAVNNTIPIPSGSNVTLTLTRQVPDDAPALTLALDRLRMQSQFDRETPASDTPLRIIVATLRGVEATVDGPGHSVVPGEETEFTLGLQSLGNVNQTVKIRPLLPSGDWSARYGDDTSSSWNVEIPAFARMEIPVFVRPAPTTPPGLESGRIDFEVTGTGFGAQTIGLTFEVEERRAINVVPRELVKLEAGRLNEVGVAVGNTGNIELKLQSMWEGLPDWESYTETIELMPGQKGTLYTWLWVPPEAVGLDDFTANLEFADASGSLSISEWTFSVNTPRLEATIEEIRPINDDQARYSVRVINSGEDSARNVTVLLDHAEDGTLDNFLILQIRPGASAVANLVGPTDTRHIQVRVIADHDPVGFQLDTFDIDLDEQEIPGPAPVLVFALAVAITAIVAPLRRYRS